MPRANRFKMTNKEFKEILKEAAKGSKQLKKTPSCPSIENIHLFFLGEKDAKKRFKTHIETCAYCQQELLIFNRGRQHYKRQETMRKPKV